MEMYCYPVKNTIFLFGSERVKRDVEKSYKIKRKASAHVSLPGPAWVDGFRESIETPFYKALLIFFVLFNLFSRWRRSKYILREKKFSKFFTSLVFV